MYAIRKIKDRNGVLEGLVWVCGTDYRHKYIRSDGTVTYAQYMSYSKAVTFETEEEAKRYFEYHGCSKEYYKVIRVMLTPYDEYFK